MDKKDALELLRSQHVFPGKFEFRVVVRPPAKAATLAAMTASAGAESRLVNVSERASRSGKYIALHVSLHVDEAESVLRVYEILQEVDGVVTAL